MQEGDAFAWRDVVEKHNSALLGELKSRLDAELDQAVTRALKDERCDAERRTTKACEQATTAQAESLNQLLRRLRNTSQNEIAGVLAQGAAPYAASLVVLVLENGQARIAATHGLDADSSEIFVDVEASPAIASAIESKDPIVALANAAELSPSLAQLFDRAGTAQTDDTGHDEKMYLFPVVERQSVAGMVIASSVGMSAPIELLCEAAGMRLESFAAAHASDQVASAVMSAPEPGAEKQAQEVPASATSAPRAWDDLSTEDQKLHLQAQRMARVRVAEMRLYQPNELRSGVETSNIYGCLQDAIDTARTQFLQNFLSKSPTMVDYLHLEIMRTLAHEDDRLLGHSYPGPMV
jgi:hypothetical protein